MSEQRTLFHPLAAPWQASGATGHTVVLLHGFTGTPAHLRPLAAELAAAGYGVRVPLLAGHGTTMDDLADTGADDWIDSARAAVLAAAADPGGDVVHLLGLSMGGLIALILAAQAAASPHAPRIGSVTTIDSPVIVRDPTFYLAAIGRFAMPTTTWPQEDPGLEPDMAPYWQGYESFHTIGAVSLLAVMARAVRAARGVAAPALVVQSRTDETVHPSSARVLAGLLGQHTTTLMLQASRHIATLDGERHLITDAVLTHLDRGRGR